jgi:hypothetical protein
MRIVSLKRFLYVLAAIILALLFVISFQMNECKVKAKDGTIVPCGYESK